MNFEGWAKRHALIFGFAERDALMMASWRELFAAAGYTYDELSEATRHLALHVLPRFPNEHLAAIQTRIRESRAVDRRCEDADRPTCVRCGGTGMLSVPHLAGVVGDEWRPLRVVAATYYTRAVRCSCERGRFGRFTSPRQGDLMGLDEYEQRNPHWRVQLARRTAELLAEPCHGDAPLAAALDRLRRRLCREPGQDDD